MNSKKTILITGASTGIGRATALKFHNEGWNVIATMRTPEKETELSELSDVLVTKLDVLDLATINKAIQEGIEKFGKIDVLLNNAGYGAYGPLEAFPRDNIVRQFNTNVIGLLDVSRAILPHFRQNKSGTLINVSSIGGKIAMPFGALYHGTKFAVEGISEALSFEMESIGCKVKIVEPGVIVTDFAERSLDFQNDESLTEYQAMVQALLGTVGEMMGKGSPASLCADVIYTAATDGSDRLRYRAGADAEEILDARASMDDASFREMIKGMFTP